MPRHRLNVRVTAAQHGLVRHAATQRGQTLSAVVRDAIDQALRDDLDRRRAALAHLFSLDPLPVPDDPADLEREIQEMYGRMPDE